MDTISSIRPLFTGEVLTRPLVTAYISMWLRVRGWSNTASAGVQ